MIADLVSRHLLAVAWLSAGAVVVAITAIAEALS